MKMLPSILASLLLTLTLSETQGAPAAQQPEKDERHIILRDMDGRAHDISDELASGKKVALVFWQTWCGSCKRETPEAAKAARSYDGRVSFYGVVSGPDDVVDDAKVREFATSANLPYPQIRDRDLKLTKAFDVKGTPTIIILGAENKIVYRDHHLPKEWTSVLGGSKSLKNSLRADTSKRYRY